MSQKRSEKSWDEIFAEIDAAGPFPDDFLSEAGRDMRPPQPRPAVYELFGDTEEGNPTGDELFVEEHRKGKKVTDAQD